MSLYKQAESERGNEKSRVAEIPQIPCSRLSLRQRPLIADTLHWGTQVGIVAELGVTQATWLLSLLQLCVKAFVCPHLLRCASLF